MSEKPSLPIGSVLYGCLFVIVLPVALILWARAVEIFVGLPALDLPIVGWILLAAGAVAILAGMVSLIVCGKGLPMNAYPPEKYVTTGIFRYLSHPIYVGFCLM